VGLRVVASVAEQRFRSVAWSATPTAHGRDRFDERDELSDVVAVGGAEQAGERDAAGVGD
jgi:hypothetical protein